MVRIAFIEPGGILKEVQATEGETVMQAAQSNGISGIVAECGGCLSCATCHAYIPEDWLAKMPPPTADETVMVECAVGARPNSRLSCQIRITQELDGLVVEVPPSQY
jgi:2Fe-2S ferredoxin